MKVLISGASGMIGSALLKRLEQQGDEAWTLKRAGEQGRRSLVWNFHEPLDAARLEGFDAIVHLAGKPVACRWTADAKEAIVDSRVNSTRLLAEAAARARRLHKGPQIFICASAIGYYGDRGAEHLDERSEPGEGFLSMVAQQWEAACWPAQQAGLRVVCARMGIVLSPSGGALKKMLPLFKLGLGGELGSGRQFWSWISLNDAVAALDFALREKKLVGAVNFCSPLSISNRSFTQLLAATLRRPAFMRAPVWALKFMMGEMAEEMLLASQRVEPRKLKEAGFVFRDVSLTDALTRGGHYTTSDPLCVHAS